MKRFISTYFKKNIDDITFSDLQNFIAQKIEENQNLEYKPRGILLDKDNKIIKPKNEKEIKGFLELAKCVTGFANAEGGLLILGVKEKGESFQGTTIKRMPSDITPLSPSVTKEIIENNLFSKIQFPIENLLIKPLTNPKNSNETVFLIDVPQSNKAPHRVNEINYYQRYNFSTLEMKHYQIADLFGRRTGPHLEIEIEKENAINSQLGNFAIKPLIHNRGNYVAKFVSCICEICGPYKLAQTERNWHKRNDQKSCEFSTGSNSVIYPDIPTDTGYIEIQPESQPNNLNLPILLVFHIMAEKMERKRYEIILRPPF